jgi:hypothetical protein
MVSVIAGRVARPGEDSGRGTLRSPHLHPQYGRERNEKVVGVSLNIGVAKGGQISD